MTQRTATHGSAAAARPVAGLLMRLWAWLIADKPTGTGIGAAPETLGRPPNSGAVVLPFPIRGEALLVKLAELLRRRVSGRAIRPDAFALTIARNPRTRLVVDCSSYVEFDPNIETYCMVVAAGAGTTITVATTDFDTIVQIVIQYIDGRLIDVADLEVAS